MTGSGRRIVGHSGIYLAGSLLSRAVSFIMLPVYTRNLTPADYGVIELLSMIIDLAGVLVSLRIGQSVYRFYFKYDDEADRREVLSTAYGTAIATGALGLVCIAALAHPLAVALFGDAAMAGIIRLFSLSLLFQGMVETPMVMIRARQRPFVYLAASVGKLVLMLGLNIYFIVVRGMRVEGVVYSAVLSGGIMAVILGFYLLKDAGLSFSPAKAFQMMRFSLPLIAVGLLSFYINFGDRYFLRLNGGGLSEVGVYSLGYKFGFLLTFIAGDPFYNVWDSEKFRIYKEGGEDALSTYGTVFSAYLAALTLVLVGVSLYGRTAITVMAAKEYWKAADLIPFVCLAYACNCIMGYANLGLLVKEKTIEMTYGTVIAAVVVTAGYLVLIPRFGAMGAAWATLFAFASRLAWVSLRSRRYFDMRLRWRSVPLVGVVAAAALFASTLLRTQSILLSLVVDTVIIVACAALLFWLPVLPEVLREDFRRFLASPRTALRHLAGVSGVK